MSETRKIAAILVADVVGYSRLAGADQDLTLARLRALRSDNATTVHIAGPEAVREVRLRRTVAGIPWLRIA